VKHGLFNYTMYVLHLEYNFKIGCLRPHASAHTLVLNEESLSLSHNRSPCALWGTHGANKHRSGVEYYCSIKNSRPATTAATSFFLHSLRAQSLGCALKINTHITRMHATGAKNEEWTRAMLRADEINFALPRRESIYNKYNFISTLLARAPWLLAAGPFISDPSAPGLMNNGETWFPSVKNKLKCVHFSALICSHGCWGEREAQIADAK
jgi:hypothetical protein